jgi:serine-type D-Ala-D-Ala carboxypeptidase/endopeptidase (penicillin-binding protein 4)
MSSPVPLTRRTALLFLGASLSSCLHPPPPSPSGSRVSAPAPGPAPAPASDSDSDSGPDSAPAPSASAPAVPPRPPLSAAALDDLRARIDALLAPLTRAGASVSALVLHLATRSTLYARDPDSPLIPASNEKLFTTSVALATAGPAHTLTTRVLAPAEPDGGRVVSLTLEGAGDFSWSTAFRDRADAPLDDLAVQARARGVRHVGEVRAEGDLYLDAARFDELDPAKHRAAVLSAFRRALRRAGVRVGDRGSGAITGTGAPVELARITSPPFSAMCVPINRMSHNGFAEALFRTLARAGEGQPAVAPATVVRDALRTLDVPLDGLVIADGSGLSRNNRTTARSLAGLLAAMNDGIHGDVFEATLASAGETGTLSGRLRSDVTRGRVRGKTGSVAEVVALSGYVLHQGRREVAFSLLMNGVKDGTAARAVEDAAVEALVSALDRARASAG